MNDTVTGSPTRTASRTVRSVRSMISRPSRFPFGRPGNSIIRAGDGRSPDLPGGVGVGSPGHDRGAVSRLGPRFWSGGWEVPHYAESVGCDDGAGITCRRGSDRSQAGS